MSKISRRVLVFGATGVLGRPVVRALVAAGFQVRAFVRDARRARRLLPAQCELACGDLRDPASVERALRSAPNVYMNLSHPLSRYEPYDPDRDGTALVVRLARTCGVRRLMRLSAIGVEEAKERWWVASRKATADRSLAESGVPYTIFRGDSFMETIPQLVMGRLLFCPEVQPTALHWIAGEDFGRQVANALSRSDTANEIYDVQGPEALSFGDACERFRELYPKRLFKVLLPKHLLQSSDRLGFHPGSYLNSAMTHSVTFAGQFRAERTWEMLGRPTVHLVGYVNSLRTTRDFPRKSAAWQPAWARPGAVYRAPARRDEPGATVWSAPTPRGLVTSQRL